MTLRQLREFYRQIINENLTLTEWEERKLCEFYKNGHCASIISHYAKKKGVDVDDLVNCRLALEPRSDHSPVPTPLQIEQSNDKKNSSKLFGGYLKLDLAGYETEVRDYRWRPEYTTTTSSATTSFGGHVLGYTYYHPDGSYIQTAEVPRFTAADIVVGDPPAIDDNPFEF